MSADKFEENREPIDLLGIEAHLLIKQGYCERALKILERGLRFEHESNMRAVILDEIGFCLLKLGWFEEAVKVYTEYLKIRPHDNDGRFFLASAYASLKWTDEAIQELKRILLSDPSDVLARHDLALCFRNQGWLKESLEEMRKANDYAIMYGNPEEKEIIKSSLGHIEAEIQEGDEDGAKEIFLLMILLATVLKRSKPKARKPLGKQ